MEGITGYVYRNAISDFYGRGVSRYFSPFVTYHPKRILNTHERMDLCPENNKKITLIPQILTNNTDEFFEITHFLKEEYGYSEVDLNMGCPSGTVVSKGRGAGFLADPDGLEKFLYEIFEHTEMKVSVKTRIGYSDRSEFPELMRIYSQFPLSELIIHPRLRTDLYNGSPDVDLFMQSFSYGDYPICYNGDIDSREKYDSLVTKIHSAAGEDAGIQRLSAVMCGRGMIARPYLIEELSGESDDVASEDVHRLRDFHDRIIADYMEAYDGDGLLTLKKMKEIWTYMRADFPGCDRQLKELFKARDMSHYNAAVSVLFSSRY